MFETNVAVPPQSSAPLPLSFLPPTDERNDRKGRSLVVGVVAIGLLGTTLLAWSSYTQAQEEHHHREQPTADLVLSALQRKLASTESVLRGLAGLDLASEAVTLSELQRFVGSVESDGRSLDGIGILGYAAAESGKAPIRLIAPLDASSRRLLGSDLWSQVHDPGNGLRQDRAPSESWLLPGRSGPGQPTFLMQILPFGSSVAAAGPGPTPPARWAFATLPLRDFLRAALHHPLIQLKEPIKLQLYSGERADPPNSSTTPATSPRPACCRMRSRAPLKPAASAGCYWFRFPCMGMPPALDCTAGSPCCCWDWRPASWPAC